MRFLVSRKEWLIPGKRLKGMLTEEQEQGLLHQWSLRHPDERLKLLFAIPNGGQRNAIVGAKLKATGVKKGVPDLLLPVANKTHHGLFIELKRIKGASTSPEQKAWIAKLNEQGYMAVVCRGFEEAKKTIEDYLGL